MAYTKLFDPQPLLQDFRSENERARRVPGDRRDGKIYLYDEKIVLGVNVALVTGRPLLVRGSPGCGKSSLAYNIARVMKRRYYEYVVASQTQAQDLLWRYDAVRRLADAQIEGYLNKKTAQRDTYQDYIEPGLLWWIYDRESARQNEPKDPVVYDPGDTHRAVILLDEIDKADPDFPNNLLVPFGSLRFVVKETQEPVAFKTPSALTLEDLPLVILTTNEQRRLPKAFLRRCVELKIEDPDRERLIDIARATEGAEHTALYERIIHTMDTLAAQDGHASTAISIAEYLDAVRACIRLTTTTDEDILQIIEATIWKKKN